LERDLHKKLSHTMQKKPEFRQESKSSRVRKQPHISDIPLSEQKEHQEGAVDARSDVLTAIGEPAPEQMVKSKDTTIQQNEPLPVSAQLPSPHRKRLLTFVIAGGAVLVVAVFLIVMGLGFYRARWHNTVADSIAGVLPYPAITVGTHLLTMEDFYHDSDALTRYYQKQAELYPDYAKMPERSLIEKLVLNKMVEDYIVDTLATQRGVTVTDSGINDEFQKIIANATSQEEVTRTLQDLYGWTEDQFKQEVLRSYILRTKLQEQLMTAGVPSSEEYKLAQEVLDNVKAGDKSFEDIAKEFSEDSTAEVGGDLGYFERGQMVRPFEEAAFTLDPGEVSDIVTTEFGYHVIKVEERLPAAEDGSAGETVRARHILILGPQLSDTINEFAGSEKVHIYLTGLFWEASCSRALADGETCETDSASQVAPS